MSQATDYEAKKELLIRELESRTEKYRNNLVEFMKYHFKKEKNREFFDEWVHHEIAKELQNVIDGKTTRLIINIPPRHGKTSLITEYFPNWALWHRPNLEIISTGYSSTLTQWFSQNAKDIYKSKTFNEVFPRRTPIRTDQDTKEYWKNESWWSYYATGTSGSITGKWANIFIIDDPIKPDEADSDIIRLWVNNWFDNTVTSRLNNPLKDAIIIIMQRTHENDLCGHLIEQMEKWYGEEWKVLSFPAIAIENEEHRQIWEALCPKRFPVEALEVLRQGRDDQFECQYQQNPVSERLQEFHKEWFRYYQQIPQWGRIFTTVDPAFSKKKTADQTVITTVKFIEDTMYILEQTCWKYNPDEMEDEIMRHAKVWNPETIWVEAFQAQTVVAFSLNNRLKKEKLYIPVEEIKQKQDKKAKIRALVPLYRNWLIYHNYDMQTLEEQLIKFPRWRHDDAPDGLQMALYLYELQPNTHHIYKMPEVKYDRFGMPFIWWSKTFKPLNF